MIRIYPQLFLQIGAKSELGDIESKTLSMQFKSAWLLSWGLEKVVAIASRFCHTAEANYSPGALHGEVAGLGNEGGLEKLSWQMVKQATNSDEELVVVRKMLEKGDIVDVKSCPRNITQMYAKSELAVFWSSLHADLEKTRADCHTFRTHSCTVKSKPYPA